MASEKTIVLITGANQGIGYLAAEVIAAASPKYHVILTSRSLSKGQIALSELRAQNPLGSFSLVQLDVTSGPSITAACASVSQEFGHLDVLINNAGISHVNPPLIENLRSVFETNTFGPAIVTDSFRPLLEKAPHGARLIYVSSDLGSLALREDPAFFAYALPAVPYRMSKAALNMLALCHSVELRARGNGIRVWAFNPGFVVTNLTGEHDRQRRVDAGAGDPRDSAVALLAIVRGERDGEVGKHVFKDGVHPW